MRPFAPMTRGRLGVFAPSSPFPEDRFEAGCARLRALGFELLIPPLTYARQGYLAGTDDERTRAFHALLDDPEVTGLIAARGGYGLHRLLERLDPARLAATTKPVVGFSDICALHSVLQGRGGLTSIHGPVVTQLAELPEQDALHLADLLRGVPLGPLEAEGPTLSPGAATGPLAGGCLSVLAPLVGTPFLWVPEGAVLLLEDVGEAPYRLDRLLTHLRLAGVLDRVAAVALGAFHGCKRQRPDEPDALEVLAERLGGLGIPVLAGLPVGHGARNAALPLGAPVTLDADARTLRVLAAGAPSPALC
jgi:muramoyltetrapeptide carboxypeptidase